MGVSVKNGSTLSLSTNTSYGNHTAQLANCSGRLDDAITASRARGAGFQCMSVFQLGALRLLTLAHGQAATSTAYCAWYDSSHITNFPKGATNEDGTDYNDSSIKYNAHSYGSTFAKTGSSNDAEKVSHNGQLCGIMDVAGMCNQWCIGATNKSRNTVGLMKLSVSAHDFTKDNRVDNSLHETFNTGFENDYKNFSGLRNGKSGTANWASCGVIPTSLSSNTLFGNDEYYEYYYGDVGLKMGLGFYCGETAGVFCRSFGGYFVYGSNSAWNSNMPYYGFRASGYAP